jgi:hypothetical protein
VAGRAPWQTLAISTRPERRLDTFNNGIKSALVRGRINQREAVDEAATAATGAGHRKQQEARSVPYPDDPPVLSLSMISVRRCLVRAKSHTQD